MGKPKGIVPYQGKPWIREQLDRFKKVGGKRVCIVLGFQHEEYFKIFPWLQEAQDIWMEHEGLHISTILNPLCEMGQFSSIQAGIKSHKFSKNYEGVYLMPIDTPCPEVHVWNALAIRIRPHTYAALPTFNNKGGHPVFLSSDFMQELIKVPVETKDARLDMQIHELSQEKVERVPVTDEKITMNLDTPEQFKAFSF
jgi:CTP:molybdopterin cytidylyltransferase MocA